MAKKNEQIIKITCQGAAMVPIETLQKFQGSLKTLESKKYDALKNAIEQYGFSFPMQVWKNGKANSIIDGHQRLFVISKMLEEGFVLESGAELPVSWIHAKNKQEAKEKVLLAMSEYGTYDENALAEFIQENQLDYNLLRRSISPPKINMGTLHVGWFAEMGGEIDLGDMTETDTLAGGKQFEDKPYFAVLEIAADRVGDEDLKTALELFASEWKLGLTFRR